MPDITWGSLSRRPWCRGVLACVIVAQLAACRTWQPTHTPPVELTERQRPSRLRVTDSEGTQSVLVQPYIRNDSILSPSAGTVGVPLDAVIQTELKNKLAVGSTVAAVVLWSGLAALLYWGYQFSSISW